MRGIDGNHTVDPTHNVCHYFGKDRQCNYQNLAYLCDDAWMSQFISLHECAIV